MLPPRLSMEIRQILKCLEKSTFQKRLIRAFYLTLGVCVGFLGVAFQIFSDLVPSYFSPPRRKLLERSRQTACVNLSININACVNYLLSLWSHLWNYSFVRGDYRPSSNFDWLYSVMSIEQWRRNSVVVSCCNFHAC